MVLDDAHPIAGSRSLDSLNCGERMETGTETVGGDDAKNEAGVNVGR